MFHVTKLDQLVEIRVPLRARAVWLAYRLTRADRLRRVALGMVRWRFAGRPLGARRPTPGDWRAIGPESIR